VSSLENAIARIAASLDQVGHPWALVGALAVAAHAEARATLDVDVAVAVKDADEAAAVVSRLRHLGYTWRADFGAAMTSFEVPEGPPGGLRLDVLFSLTGIESEIAIRAQRMEILPGLHVPVALVGDLIAIKLLAAGEPGREHDWRDLRALVARATPEDIEHARSSIAHLSVRDPLQRGRLDARLERLLARSEWPEEG
jgi:predicted nucleotidyltransferase